MAFIRTFEDQALDALGCLAVSDTVTDGELFVGIKMVDADNLQKVRAVFALNRAETKALVMMLTEALNREARRVH